MVKKHKTKIKTKRDVGYIILWKGNLLTKSGQKGIEEMIVVTEDDSVGMHFTRCAANSAIEQDRDGTPWHRDDYTIIPLVQ